jgi:hypothetical protein
MKKNRNYNRKRIFKRVKMIKKPKIRTVMTTMTMGMEVSLDL